jgi:two-component system, NarL family, invasion response regulator UvrY
MIPVTPVLRAVLVGDVDDLRWVLRLGFERSGFVHVVAESLGDEVGMSAALLARPDLAVVDLDMAAGLDAVRRLRAWSPRTAVVVLTGGGDDERTAAALELGASGVLRKGSQLSVIADRARAFAEEHRAS